MLSQLQARINDDGSVRESIEEPEDEMVTQRQHGEQLKSEF